MEEGTKGWKSGAAAGFHQIPKDPHAAHTFRGDILPLPEQENSGHKQIFCIHHAEAITVYPPRHYKTDGHNLWLIL